MSNVKQAGHGHDSPAWVLVRVAVGEVRRDDDFRYRVEGSRVVDGDGVQKTCCDAVYRLEDAGLVVLHSDGQVTPAVDGLVDTSGAKPALTVAGRARLAQMDGRQPARPTTPRRRPTTVPVFRAA